jgi:phosphohistidine swiveling domain-containing protein
VVRQDCEAILRKRWAQHVAQKASAGVVVDRARAGPGVQIETAVLHHEVTDDLGSSTCGEKHGLALAFGRARGWQTGNRRSRQLRQHRVPGRERLVYLQRFGVDPDHPSALQRSQDPHLGDLNHVCHLVGLQVAKRSEDRLALGVRHEYAIQPDDVQGAVPSRKNSSMPSLPGAGSRPGETAFEGRIAVASELLPSDVLMLGLQKVGGLVLLSGGVTSHVSVLARSLDLPLLIVEDPRLLQIPDGTRVVLDGTQGNLLVGPTAEVEEKFREQTELRQSALHLGERMLDTTHTSDGTRVRLLANINLLADLDVARAYKAEGVGLYRTEFPFMIRNDFPSEEEQIRVYRRLVESMPGREITFRTLDVGSDKMLSYFNYGAEANPFLGLRSIRLSLRHRDLFLQQLRAILRAAHDAEVRIMFPMITSPDELDQAADAVDECRAALQREGAQSCSEVRIGMMLEVPSVLELMDQLAKRAEFFSIGTASVHPRACGERKRHLEISTHGGGSSPRVRGTAGAVANKAIPIRFIPARAGNGSVGSGHVHGGAVHPRACGERSSHPPSAKESNGSSPRVRGTGFVEKEFATKSRFIPARAGNGPRAVRLFARRTVHPRACGERSAP